MKFGIELCTALAITASVILGSNLGLAQEIEPATTKCGCEVCLLETKTIKEKKTCFKVEEKVICVPAIRMPWHKCNPPTTSKTKTIKVLKKESYESPASSYKWSVAKAGETEPTATKTATDNKPMVANSAGKPMSPVVRASKLKLRLRKGTDFAAPAK